MKTENIVALSFVLGAISGIGIFVWIVFYPPPSWSNDNHFTNFSERLHHQRLRRRVPSVLPELS